MLTALLTERLRVIAHEEANREPVGRVDLALQIWDKTRSTFAVADYANLDRKLAFINAMSEIRAAM